MGNFKKYLESSILDEHEIVTYRILARKFEVHVNVAKRMLYEFHNNHKKDGSVYATYIITGERREVIHEADDDEDEDEDMSGSPFGFTPLEKKEKFRYQKIVQLVGEERLEGVKSKMEDIKTVHVYSLGPSRIKDLSVLSACSERVRSEFVYEDDQAAGKVYGMIVNRLAIKTPKPIRPPARPHVTAGPVVSKANERIGAKEKVEAESKPDTKAKAKHEPETKTEKKPTPAQLKRSQSAGKAAQKKQGHSNLFTSWGNAAKKKAESNPSSTAHSPKTEEDPVKMELDSEEEDDIELTPLRDTAEDARKRREKDDELTKMMEMSDDEDIKLKPKRRVREEVREGEVEEMEEEAEEEDQEAQEAPEKKPVELPTGSVVGIVAEGGRRRGRRKVNKKVQVKDEDGYLVTRLEPAWESFSEEEPAPKPKPKPKPAPKGKKKNAGPTPGQGSINSYFFKK